MAYQVLARKWRPQNFTEIVGQEHVSKSLINALQHQRLHHAYLFTGTRGVGKTTIARILAKAINCENLQDFNPCGQCAVCTAFDNGRFMDLIEVDAASRTKVEDTRDLLDNAQYAPNQGQYKVYLIDEVHMLSGHSFNALLKTLEEPPPHVKFLLATTDPQKIPVTVLSRCLQFNLKRLLPEQIAKQMDFILNEEKIEYDPPALTLLARAADGSMRDGLSLLDQAIVFGQGRVNQLDVSAMLGTVAQQPVDDLLHALANADGNAILEKVREIADLSADFSDVLQQLLRVLHRVALLQVLPSFKDQEFDAQMLSELAQAISPEDIQLYYQIALTGQKDLELAPDARMGFEMVMLRMLTFRPVSSTNQTQSIAPSSRPQPAVRNAVSQAPIRQSESPTPSVAPQAVVVTPEANNPPPYIPEQQPPAIESPIPNNIPAYTPEPQQAAPQSTAVAGNDWASIISIMGLRGLTKELADNCVLKNVDERHCYLEVDPNYTMAGTKPKEKLEAALQNYYQKPLKLRISAQSSHNVSTPALHQHQQREEKQQAAENSINSDPNVYALKEHFEARVMPNTTTPIDTNE
ncbi:MAG: DNA polymerase III subunit gamma/tau [Methylococcaceae bacterium]|nr:DNA polymerase III subunit gamma/tau [Methylococcaceae bacterium]